MARRDMSWQRISLHCDRDRLELICALLDGAGAVATSLEDGSDQPIYEPAPGETALWPTVRVSALLAGDVPLHSLRARLDEALGRDAHLEVESLADRDWKSAWRERFTLARYGRRLWVAPPEESPPTAAIADAVTVRMVPGLAFGSGSHASTAMCLEWLDAQDLAGVEVVDFGCGSGILAIAALKLGARHAYALDHDEQALISTRENARRNAVSAALTVARPEAVMPRDVDVIVANILADPLIGLAPWLARLAATGARLALAGLLTSQVEPVRAAYSTWFTFDSTHSRADWVRLAATRNERPLTAATDAARD